MRTQIMIVTILGAAFAAGGAHAQSGASHLEQAVERLCVAGHADQARVLALAAADGWADTGPATNDFTKTMGNEIIGTPVERTKVDGDKTMALVVGRGYVPGPNGERIGTNFCAVGEPGVSNAELRAVVAQTLGFAPVQSDATSDLYVFSEEGGARTPFTAQQSGDALKAAEAGKMSMINAGSNEAVMVYAVATGVLPAGS